MATTYTWKVTTLEHDRALEMYLNKVNTEEGWEVVFILPAERRALSLPLISQWRSSERQYGRTS